jgi:hypothetical protein
MSEGSVPADCWLHPATEVRASPIEGNGLAATAEMPAGEVVARLGGHTVTDAELSLLLAAAVSQDAPGYVDTITVDEDAHLVLPDGAPVHFLNHSCDPNVWHVDAFTIATRRHVNAGEELTIDYATHSGLSTFRMDCSCGSPRCRAVITGDDWRLDVLRERYGDHWVPGLVDRIRSQRGRR